MRRNQVIRRSVFWALVAVLALPLSASGEVSDKAASIPMHWIVAAPLAAILFLAASVRWWLSVPLLLVPAFFVFATLDLTLDPHVGSALLHEQGWVYFLSMWASDALMLVALGAGAWRDWSRRESANRWPAA